MKTFSKHLWILVFLFFCVSNFSYAEVESLEKLIVFGVELRHASRKDIREAIKSCGLPEKEELMWGRVNEYDPSEYLEGSDYLGINYLPENRNLDGPGTDRDKLAEIRYMFPFSREQDAFQKVLLMIESKYGLSHGSMDNLNKGITFITWWNFKDGTRISLHRTRDALPYTVLSFSVNENLQEIYKLRNEKKRLKDEKDNSF